MGARRRPQVEGGRCPGFAGRYTVLFPAELIANDIHLLPLEADHIEPLTMLPLHHKDPFDRLIAATALVERLPLVFADAMFDAYGVTRLW